MASSHTANYGLSLWEPGDKFLREEFNGDNEKLDGAIRRAEALAETAGNNVYNLMLRQYYEGMDCPWKKAMVFDGFRDGDMTLSMTDGLLRGQNCLLLGRKGQTDVDLGHTTSNNSLANHPKTKTCTAVGTGLLTGFRFKTMLVGIPQDYVIVTWTLTVNGVQAQQGSTSLFCPIYETEQTIRFTHTAVSPGDTFSIQLKSATNGCFSYRGPDGGLGGTILFTPVTAVSGGLTTPALDLPERTLLQGWVRHAGGSVALSVLSGGTAWPLTPTGSRATVNARGAACTETAFRLNGGFPRNGDLAFRLDLDLGADEHMSVFDYAVMMA